MTNKYIAVQVEYNGMYSAYTLKVSSSDNLLAKLDIKGIWSANLCNTKKEASRLVNVWNQGFKDRGVFGV